MIRQHVIYAGVLASAAFVNNCQPGRSTQRPSDVVTIAGREKLGWTQEAVDAAELSSIVYHLYVDGGELPLHDVTCRTSGAIPGFECVAPLPPLAAGGHALSLVASYRNRPGELAAAPPVLVVVGGDARNTTRAQQK